MRPSLVILQVALTLVLLVAAGVLLKSFWRLSSTDPGQTMSPTVATIDAFF